MELQELIQELSKRNNKDLELDVVNQIYLDYVRSTFRDGTYRHHEGHLRIISNYLKSLGVNNTKDIKMDMIYRFSSYMKDQGVSNTTINKRTQVLRRSIDKSIELGYVSLNPLKSVKKLKEITKETDIIPLHIIERIFNYLDDQILLNEKQALRNKLILFLFLETGIRVSELCALNYEDINFEERYIHLKITKTNEERIIYLGYIVFHELRKYLDHYNIFEGILFKTHYNKRMTPNGVSKFLDKIKKALNINISISAHKWRHSCATYSLANGGYVEEVQKLLGHKSLKTTNKYVHVKNEIVKNMVQRSSPVSKLVNKF